LQHVAPGGGTRDLELQFQRLTRPDDALGRKGLPEIVEIQHPAGRIAEMDAQVDGPDPGGAGSPRSRADVRHPRRYRKWFPWSNPSLRHVHLQLGFQTGALAAVGDFGSGLGEEEQPAVAEVLPRRIQIALPTSGALQEGIELVERQVEREAAEYGDMKPLESSAARPILDLAHPDVILQHAEGAHLVLGLRRPRVIRTRLGEPGDAAGLEHAAHLAQDLLWIGYVMEGVVAEDPVDALIGQVEPAAVERKEPRRRLLAEDRIARIELPADLEGRRGRVHGDDFHAELGEVAGGPARTSPEIEDHHLRSKLEAEEDVHAADEQLRGLVDRGERLAHAAVE